jgi:uncharacterized protein YbjQ (UPF0145 family)
MTVTQLQAIAATGGGLIVDANNYTVTQLQAVAATLGGRAILVVRNANQYTTTQCQAIAASGKNVIFDVTN